MLYGEKLITIQTGIVSGLLINNGPRCISRIGLLVKTCKLRVWGRSLSSSLISQTLQHAQPFSWLSGQKDTLMETIPSHISEHGHTQPPTLTRLEFVPNSCGK